MLSFFIVVALQVAIHPYIKTTDERVELTISLLFVLRRYQQAPQLVDVAYEVREVVPFVGEHLPVVHAKFLVVLSSDLSIDGTAGVHLGILLYGSTKISFKTLCMVDITLSNTMLKDAAFGIGIVFHNSSHDVCIEQLILISFHDRIPYIWIAPFWVCFSVQTIERMPA